MLNIYRVISLSLVMSLFFAAPLLCIQPVSYKLREERSMAVKDRQSKRVRVVWKRGSPSPQVRAAAALATSLQRSDHSADGLRYQSENRVATPVIFVQEQDEDWHDDDSGELDDRPSGVNGVSPTSHTSIYY